MLWQRVRVAVGLAAASLAATVMVAGSGTAAQGADTSDEDTVSTLHSSYGDPALAPLAWFVGNWKCQQTDYPPDGGPIHSKVKTKVRWTLGGKWLDWSVVQQPNPTVPNPSKGNWIWGWDATKNQFVADWHDSEGFRSQQWSPGWNGDTLLFEGTVYLPFGAALPSRDTFTRTGSGSVRDVGTVLVGGNWLTISEITCVKG